MGSTKRVFFFLLAAVLGAFARFGIGECFHASGHETLLAYGVFVSNVLGCFFFGFFWVYLTQRKKDARILLVGFMGSFTTFSSYIYDIYMFIHREEWGHIMVYGLLQMGLALVFLHMGMRSMHRVMAKNEASI